MRLIRSLFMVLACSFMLGSPAMAAMEGVGVVNIQKIMRESKAANSVREQLKSKQKSFQSELDAKEKALQQEEQTLAKQSSTLSEDALKQKVEAFRSKAISARQEIANKRAQLDKGFSGALGKIQETTLGIIQEIAKEKKLNLVLSSSQVLYADSPMDITAEVLNRLNSKLPNVTVTF